MADTPQGGPPWGQRPPGPTYPPPPGPPQGGGPSYPPPNPPPAGPPPYGGAPPGYGAPPAPPQYPGGGWGTPPGPPIGARGGRLNPFAGWSFGLGLGSVIIGPLGILAIIFGIVALVQMSHNRSQRGRWQAITGIVTGVILGLVGTAIGIGVIIGSSHLDTSRVQSEIKTDIESSGGQVKSVSCPSSVPKKTGHVFTCTVTFANGDSRTVQVTELGNNLVRIGS